MISPLGESVLGESDYSLGESVISPLGESVLGESVIIPWEKV